MTHIYSRFFFLVVSKIINLKEWFFKNCLNLETDNNEMSLELLDEYMNMYSKSASKECRVVNFIFTSMFDLQVTSGIIKFGDAFEKKMLKWLNGNQKYLEQSKNQVLRGYIRD